MAEDITIKRVPALEYGNGVLYQDTPPAQEEVRELLIENFQSERERLRLAYGNVEWPENPNITDKPYVAFGLEREGWRVMSWYVKLTRDEGEC